MLGLLSSGGGMNILIPGYFACAGILVFAAIASAAVGVYRKRVPLYLAYAATCLFSAGVCAAMGGYYLSESINGAIAAQRVWNICACLLVLSTFSFVYLYTESEGQHGWFYFLAIWCAVMVTANFLLPYGVRYASVESIGWIYMPWGEALFTVEGTTGAWNVAYRLVATIALVWMLAALVRQYRRGDVGEALWLAGYLIALFVASVQGYLIDKGLLRTFHWAGFVLVGLALLMGAHLVMRLREQNLALSATARDLRIENERRREAEARIRERAYNDPLTGLPTRHATAEHIAGLLEPRATPAFGALLICDLDHFKVVNDALSHGVGDEVLREAARRVTEIAAGKAMVARTGGDSFTLVLDGVWTVEAEARRHIDSAAEAVTAAFAAPVRVGDRSINVTASTGVTTFPLGEGTHAGVASRAEMALTQAKRRGRNNFQVFTPDMQQKAENKYRVFEGLRRAIDDHELSLHYQAQVDAEGRVLGAEALTRWRSAALGQVSPGIFIPAAEETGLIHTLGEWSLTTACRQIAAWEAAKVPFEGHVAVNVSPWQLARADFVPRLRRILSASGIKPRRLTIEVTESVVLFDVAETIARLNEVGELGVRIALDDFGTGYSSLSLLKDLPLDEIKIDQSFVRHLSAGGNQQLIKMVLAIAGELGLDVIVEGVETERERELLLGLGCRGLQGFLFCRPLSVDDFAEWLGGHAAPGPAVTQYTQHPLH